ncbi:MAG: MCE family protein [Prevotella sp.]|nr:MCE family protein [Prevotella sp.]
MNKIFTKEVKIAIVAIVALVALYFGMNFLKGLSVFSDTSTYKMTFSNLKGLSRSTPIYADGYKVGTVTDIIYDYKTNGNITVEAEIDPELRIPAGSTASIESDIMGNIKVTLLLANNMRERIEPGGTIPGATENSTMAQMHAMIPAVQAMLPKLDSIMISLNKLLADPAIATTLHNAATVSANLTTTTTELNTLLATLNNNVPGVMEKANNTLANTETLTANLNKLDIEGTMAKVNNTLNNVERITTAINNREGTLGLLIYDKGLYNHLNTTLSDADSLVVDLKAHPKRYVHFSVFGRKDK